MRRDDDSMPDLLDAIEPEPARPAPRASAASRSRHPAQPLGAPVAAPRRSQRARAVSIAVDENLRRSVRNALASAHTAGDYTYSNFPAVVRAAAAAYLSGRLRLVRAAEPGPKLKTTIWLPVDLLEQLERRLDRRIRSEVLERAVRSLLALGLPAELAAPTSEARTAEVPQAAGVRLPRPRR